MPVPVDTHFHKMLALLQEMGVDGVEITEDNIGVWKTITVTDTASDHTISFVFEHGKYGYCDTPLRGD